MSLRQLKISQSITTRESPSLDKYLQEINRIEMVSPEEEVRLSGLIRKGDKTALNQLTKANLRFVVSVAKQFQGQGLSLSDLINEGNLGLMKAAERFDESRGFKFISYAVWHIRQSILGGLASHARLVRLPMNKVFMSSRIRKTQSLLEQQFERQPSPDELAEAMNVETAEISRSISHSGKHISLDAPSNDDEETNLLDVMENHGAPKADAELSHQSLKYEINRTLQVLPDRQRETLCYFFGIGVERPLSLEDIGRKYDLTTERVRQIKDKALEKLKAQKNIGLLRGFLGS
ncbi:MAG: RNA polymerase sigma factor RpoD/SigA [Bacteroidota bacterium]|nr:RNA polymerase sigma factor RpoD/SigA [Bacteroidota bacterium]